MQRGALGPRASRRARHADQARETARQPVQPNRRAAVAAAGGEGWTRERGIADEQRALEPEIIEQRELEPPRAAPDQVEAAVGAQHALDALDRLLGLGLERRVLVMTDLEVAAPD